MHCAYVCFYSIFANNLVINVDPSVNECGPFMGVMSKPPSLA